MRTTPHPTTPRPALRQVAFFIWWWFALDGIRADLGNAAGTAVALGLAGGCIALLLLTRRRARERSGGVRP